MSIIQQGAKQHCHQSNQNYGEITLKMISITRLMWYLRKSLSGDGIYSNFQVAGKKFISETTKWIEFWNQGVNAYKDIALKVLMVMPALFLQKPSFKSTAKQHSQCLSKRLTQWEQGEFDDLLREVKTIQAKLPTNHKGLNEERLAKTFAKLVLEGKINAAMKLLDHQGGSGVLPLSESTINELK